MDPEIAKLLARPTLSIPEAGRVVGLGINGSYRAAKEGQLPTVDLGKRKKVPTEMLKKMLGLASDAAEDAA